MTSRGKVLTIAGVLIFISWLGWSTASAQKAECEVCIRYGPGENCATATAETEEEATRTAQSTACGPLTNGMNDAIACGNAPPVSRRCKKR